MEGFVETGARLKLRCAGERAVAATRAIWIVGQLSFLVLASTANAACVKGRFKVESAYAVDRQTGLTWQRCTVGAQWSHGGCQGQPQAMSISEAKVSAAALGDGWRLPNARELATLIDTGCGNPAIDRRVFPDLTDDGEGAIPYWSASPVGVARLIAFVDFANARIDGHSSGFALFVRFVKDSRK
ncbi:MULTISPECIES: DUF1566 domain-containing protein [unclassified Bradyrhizobium]|uniref:Lcl C-terminal domain-containing protein n=1 Tax=unclassified Bradyrhizobium TaxID=2631580 RepID=UPI002447EA5B|nr:MULTISPECIES: DUF1566 domain-containing protein [unclassified Bradyrhizobium]MDH2348512.1 DUF1566 domain-containing protein [Bradyrhizobium sp. SSUT77]MDH2357018.1 DUF1566 domain-containing protein [Bradyrhizobium sp. SSUT112]